MEFVNDWGYNGRNEISEKRSHRLCTNLAKKNPRQLVSLKSNFLFQKGNHE